ncbi:MAG: AAA family ATPase [Synechococcus sp. SB0666_bin_14]|nr:AAA family ATPase [Synechococcus sp. SB0666_bin_14]MYA90436.1 AAA family ATPase [Synechococcus sp. SB0663_bin_10]MYG47694.1 AAA family ATPase [Synechococcus sp. SB0675_bin_6]MYJ59137.1 AAA family ATPase [Synechococcus sp. SB0672_bin_6]MYK91177.1 AAA family ATPase [Synechococcus sp. SB0669_bin_8]
MPSFIERRLQELWNQLQGKKPHFSHFLAEIRLQGIRGINNLKATFDYPVSVIAGGNASGKSTVLFAAACAYRVPGAGVKDFVPSTLFPDYRPRNGAREDHRDEVVLNFEYATPEGHHSMRWRRRSKVWNRSFGGRKNASQPERPVYLRTLSNLSIDELEAGLHPWVQQLLMAQLQQLALRNDLQVIVTTHSPVVLDSVPRNGRIFLERDQVGEVTVRPAYRDIIQNALYGRSGDALNLLCEDKAAEGMLQGVLDVLLPDLEMRTESVHIGRDTGADEFPSHAVAFRKFGRIKSFIFVLDGDKRGSRAAEKLSEQAASDSVFFLPGTLPEAWVWQALQRLSAGEAKALGLSKDDLTAELSQLDALYDSASDPSVRIAKTKLRQLADALGRTEPDVARVVGRLEAGKQQSDVQPLVENLKSALLRWRDVDAVSR